MEIIEVNTTRQIEQCYELMAVLRPHLTKVEFPNQINRQMQQGYRLLALKDSGCLNALLGYRPVENLIVGKFIYVDDLVTDSSQQRKGYASRLLDRVDEVAVETGCAAVQLDSGFQNLDAHRLYLNKGFQLSAHHFRKPLDRFGESTDRQANQ